MLFTENRVWEVWLEKRDGAGKVGFWEVTCWAVEDVKDDKDASILGFIVMIS